MYIDYPTYQENGGIADQSAFPSLESRAEMLLNEWCQNRLGGNPDLESVKLALTMIIDYIHNGNGQRLTSFSNGVNSFGFADDSDDDLYQQVCRILPSELIYLGVYDED